MIASFVDISFKPLLLLLNAGFVCLSQKAVGFIYLFMDVSLGTWELDSVILVGPFQFR